MLLVAAANVLPDGELSGGSRPLHFDAIHFYAIRVFGPNLGGRKLIGQAHVAEADEFCAPRLGRWGGGGVTPKYFAYWKCLGK